MKKDSSLLASARLTHVRIAPRKVRLVADYLRGMDVSEAVGFLENTQRRVNPILLRLLKSAIANATEKDSSIDPDNLQIMEICVDQGRILKRFRPRAMGRGAPIRKRSSHVYLAVG